MNALERLLDEFSAQPAAARHGAASQLQQRQAAAEALRTHRLPGWREENWRYANLRSLEAVQRFRAAAAPADDAPPVLPLELPGHARLVFIDGRLDRRWPLPRGARLLEAGDAAARAAAAAARSFETSGDGRLGALARMFAPEPLALRLAGPLSLEILQLATAGTGGAYTQLEFVIAAGSRVELVERQLGPSAAKAAAPAAQVAAAAAQAVAAAGPAAEAATLSCGALRLALEPGAELLHTRIQQAAGQVLLYDTLSAHLAERASYRLCQVAAGGATARTSAELRLAGRGARVQIRALAAAQGGRVADSQFTVLHEAPDTHSDQLFRGIASERGHIACSADVQVSPRAPGSRVLQSLRALIDGKGAEADLRPRLTIETDDIQAQHGATTGRLDEDLLFYLLARGLEPAAARSLLKWAFLAEAFGAIEPAALRREAERAAAAQLSDAPDAELLR